jgi:integrase
MAKKAERRGTVLEGQVFQPKGREGDGRPWYVRYWVGDERVCHRAMLPGARPDLPEQPAKTEQDAARALAIAVEKARTTATADAVRGCAEVTLNDFRETFRPGGNSARHARIVAAQIKRAADPAKPATPEDAPGGNLGDEPMHRVGVAEAQKYVDALKAAGAGANTVRHHLAALSGCWEAAISEGKAVVNPWRIGGLKLDAVAAPTIRFRPEAEVAQIVARCPAQIRPLIRFIAATGCRYEEAARMTWSEIAADLSLVTIPAARTKTRKMRVIRVADPDARAVLEERRAARVVPLDASADFVFALRPATDTKPAQVYSHGYAFKILQAALDEAKIPSERPFHSLRNSLASRMVLRGIPLSVVAEAIGDSLATTAKHYGHLVPDDAVARAYQMLGRPEVSRSVGEKAAPKGRRRAARSA